MIEEHPPEQLVRWSAWLFAGIALGLVIGFAAGLARPRDHLT